MNPNNPVLYFCQITWNRWVENEEVIRNIYPYVDKLIIVDGGSTDGTIEGLEKITWENNDEVTIIDGDNLDNILWDNINKNKMIIVNYPWRDDFIASRQRYVDVVTKLRAKEDLSWCVVSDSDEYLSKRLREKLRDLCNWAEQNKIKMLKVRSRDVDIDDNYNRVKETMSNYWKELIFKWTPQLKVWGKITHHGFTDDYFTSHREIYALPSNEEKGKDFEILYEHKKNPKVVYERSHCRNFFQCGGGNNLLKIQKLWIPFRKLVDYCMVADGFEKPKVWTDYRDYLKKGNVNQKLKDWFIRYMFEGIKDRDFNKWPKSETEEYFEKNYHLNGSGNIGMEYPGASEIRESYKLYFRQWHPEEEPEELKQLNIP